MNKINKSPLLITLGTAILLVGGGMGAYLAIVSQPVKGVPTGANIVPQDTLVAVSVSTDAAQWDKLKQFGTKDAKAAGEQTLKDFQDRILAANGYDYQKDIQPWVGTEVMMAFLPHPALLPKSETPAESTLPPNQQPLIFVLPIADAAKAKELLAKPKPLKVGKVVERDYKGVNITETQGIPTQNYSVAVLGSRYLVITNDPATTNRAIDTYKGEPSLAKTPGYVEALGQIQGASATPMARLYVNIPVAATVASASAARPVAQEQLEKLQQSQGIAANASLDSDGISIKGISWLKPNSQSKLVVENKAQGMADRLPDTTLMMLSGGNLQRLWQDYTRGAQANVIAPINPDVVRSNLKAATNLDLDKDLLAWMGGEFSLSLVPAAPSQKPPVRFAAGFVFMVKASDRGAADQSLKKLDEAMKTKNFKVTPSDVQGQPIVQWTSPYGGYAVTRGWLPGNIAFLTLGAPVVAQILPQPKTPLAANDTFQKTVPAAGSPNNGNFFIDISRSFNPQNLNLPDLPPQQKVWIDAIDSIGVTTTISNERNTRYDAFVKLKKANN